MTGIRNNAFVALSETLETAGLPTEPAALLGRTFFFICCLVEKGDELEAADIRYLDEDQSPDDSYEYSAFQIYGKIEGVSKATNATFIHFTALDTRVGLIRSIRIEQSGKCNAAAVVTPGGDWAPTAEILDLGGVPGQLRLL